MEPATIGASVLKAVLPQVTKAVFAKVNSKLNPTELEKALQAGITAAEEWDKSQSSHKWLFYRCDDKQTRDFLTKVFEHPGVLGELEKPLKNEGMPDIALLVKAFEGVAADLKVDLNQSTLESWLREFVNTYFEKTSTYLKFQVAKEDYFEQLANWFDDVKFAGIPVPGQEVEKSEKLAHIFVMPDVVEEVRQISLNKAFSLSKEKTLNSKKSDLTLTAYDADYILGKPGIRQAQLIQEQRQLAQLENRTGRKFLASELLSQNQSQRYVLLGAPGSGKTTLMSYFAVMLAQKHPKKLGLDANTDWLPILIRIRDLARQPNISILDYARQFAEKTMSVKPLPTGFFEYWLEDGRAIILLDGLDEVAEEGKRYEVVRRIENFLGQFKENRAIITSRPAGYKRDFFRTEEFPHFQLQLFDDDKIEEFINHWYDSRFPDKAEAERRKESLRNALRENDRIKLLARNPLLLTIIALIHRYQAHLPKQRYKLYDKAVETLLTAWDANKELSNHAVFKCIELDDLRRLMERLAYWIHTQGSTGDKEGGTLIDKDELIEQLSKEIRKQKQIELYQAKEEAKRFVDLIRERTGLLNEQGQDCYAFVHKTFQEYLCAQEINYQADNEDDFEIVLKHISEHLHDPHWREVLLLLIAQQKPKKAAKAIRKIRENQSEYECWLHRDLLFAGSCLAEDPKNLKVENNNLSSEILTALVELEVSDSPRVGERVKSQVVRTFCRLGETDFEAEALQLLKDRADRIGKVRWQLYRAALGEKEDAIKSLLKLLEDEDSSVRRSAASALGNLGNSSQEVLSALLKLLDNEDLSMLRSAVDALVNLGNSSPEVLSALLKLLQDEDWRVRRSAALVLGKLGNSSQEVLSALLKLLQDEDSFVRRSAASALGELGNSSQEVLSALLKLLENEDSSMRRSAALVLGELGNSSQEVLSALLKLLENEDSSMRRSAALVLGELGNSSQEVLSALLKLLQDEDWRVRYSPALALVKLGNSSQEVLSALLKLLEDENLIVRRSAVDALGELGNSSQEVLSALLKFLEDENSDVRRSAAYALGKLGNSSQEVLSALLKLLEDENSDVRRSAAYALGKLGNSSQEVLSALLKLLEDEDWRVRRSAADVLAKLGNGSQKVLEALLKLLEDHVPYVRSSAADALAKLGKKSSDVVTAVAQWIEQYQVSEYVGDGIDALWDLVVSE